MGPWQRSTECGARPTVTIDSATRCMRGDTIVTDLLPGLEISLANVFELPT